MSAMANLTNAYVAAIIVVVMCASNVYAEAAFPAYKPSSRSPQAIDIRTNAYGASRTAPNALGVGDTAPDFVVPRAGGGEVDLRALRQKGPVAIIFYRGHW